MSASPLLLPRNLEALARITADNPRYACNAIHVVQYRNGGYLAEVTDGKRAVQVTGTAASAKDYPTVPALEAAPNGETQALFPGKEWLKAFKTLPKRDHGREILNNLALVMAKEVSTWATTDLEAANTGMVRNVEGRFPNVSAVMPTDAPTLVIKFDAALFAELLQIASRFAENGTVMLEFRKPTEPAVIRAKKADQEFTGVIMPISRG